MESKVFAVMPAFNEENTIREIAARANKFVDAVLVVDDGSSDGTFEEAKKAKAIVLRNIVNMGKGFSVRLGCKKALQLGAKRIVLIDSDGQHNPEDIPKMLGFLESGEAEIVFGSRPLDKNMPFIKRFGNNVINFSCRMLFGASLEDTQSGFKAFNAEVLQKIIWKSNGYSVESEIFVNAAKKRLRYREIKIKTVYSDAYKGTSIIDGVKIVLNMFWWKVFG